jgi:hypothetical protein
MKMKERGLSIKVMVGQLLPWTLAGFFAGFSMSHFFTEPLAAQLPTTQAGIAPQVAASARVFKSGAGLMLKYVRPNRVSDFEATLSRLKEALDRSNDPRRRRQAAGWRVFRAAETSLNGDIIYVFEINPVVPDADYSVATILAEAFPSEAEFLFRRYADSYAAQQNVVNLSLIAALGESPK